MESGQKGVSAFEVVGEGAEIPAPEWLRGIDTKIEAAYLYELSVGSPGEIFGLELINGKFGDVDARIRHRAELEIKYMKYCADLAAEHPGGQPNRDRQPVTENSTFYNRMVLMTILNLGKVDLTALERAMQRCFGTIDERLMKNAGIIVKSYVKDDVALLRHGSGLVDLTGRQGRK